MRYVFIYIKIICSTILTFFKKVNVKTKFLLDNPTCKLYEGAALINSTLQGYNVIFSGTQIINSEIGLHTYIQKRAALYNVSIGKYCSIAPNVTIGPGIHKMDGVSTHPAFYLRSSPLIKTFSKGDDFIPTKHTMIANDVWVGQGATIMDGLTIGNGAVIAAGAVVTKDVAPYAIVGGVPAKHIKFRFDAETIALLEKSEWWNYEESWFEENHQLMLDMDKFIAYLKCL